MAQLIVRDLEEDVKDRLKRRAERNGRSLEEEVRHILRAASRSLRRPSDGLGTRISARFSKTGLMEDLPELRGTHAIPLDIAQAAASTRRPR